MTATSARPRRRAGPVRRPPTGRPCIPIISEMPHGGVGASGLGKDMSDYSLEEYLTIKHVMSDIAGVAEKPWYRMIFKNRG